MEYIVWFIISFLLIYTVYYFFSIRKARRNGKKSSEVQFLIYQYKLDIDKFSYKKFVNIVGLITSFDIAIVATIIGKVDGIIWEILFGFVAVIPVVILTFMLVGNYYQKKQLRNNEKELSKEKKYLDKKDKKKSKKISKKKGSK